MRKPKPPLEETRPPKKHDAHQWHWLWSERSTQPSLSEWFGQWFTAGDGNSVSPQEMYRRGWRWYAIATPPKHPGEN